MRDVYLDSVWSLTPYPQAQGDGVQGRIEDLSGHKITLSSSHVSQSFKVSKDMDLAPGFLALECLRPGDIVEVKADNDKQVVAISLLVPSRGENPFSGNFRMDQAKQWMRFNQYIRSFFVDHGFVEIRTPTLVPSPGLEPFLDPFETHWVLGSQRHSLYLPTSPEFHLKKALVQGFEKCFELKECFRNGEKSVHHQPEFLMLEWYRAFNNLDTLVEDLQGLICGLQKQFFPNENVFKIKTIKMEDLWLQHLDFKLTPQTTLQELQDLAQRLNLDPREDDFDDLFNLIFLEKLEPRLKESLEPVIVFHYPPTQAALARLTSEGWADRFELYWRGLELANAFHELNDPLEQRRRFHKDQEKKRLLGKEVVPVDEEFLRALEWGMPPSSGIALGVERLFMALLRIENIKDCRLFSLS
jgi:lysyl-tRNA synthetase class 2